MSLYVKTKRVQKASTRIWFRCDDCGTYGDYTIGTLDEVAATGPFDSMAAHHRCRPVTAA